MFSILPRAHAALFAVALLLAGCAAASRPLELEDVRTETPVGAIVLFDSNGQIVEDESLPAIQGVKEELNVLALSGGGADGAFGAGLLTGWSESGKRPRFDVVTGVSTGALMATLAFLGSEYDPVMKDVYTTIKNDDIYKEKGLTSLLSDSLLDSTPLKKKIESVVTDELLDKGSQALDDASRAAAYQAVQQKVHDAFVWIPLYHEPLFLVSGAKLKPMKAHGNYGCALYKGLGIALK